MNISGVITCNDCGYEQIMETSKGWTFLLFQLFANSSISTKCLNCKSKIQVHAGSYDSPPIHIEPELSIDNKINILKIRTDKLLERINK